eukprot:GHRR01005087.1.p1 GENE.GHRR01005087.1~~GHRR01005087.1.p1  ORF type:complete len:253 (+),score=85.69 GHRR01005087.1:726-1484(+)
MPRLSDYLVKEAATQSQLVQETSQQAQEASASAASPVSAAGLAASKAVPSQEPEQAQQAIADEISRLQKQYERRLHEHGPRLYRHADGSLQTNPPAPEPLTVANRRKWMGLVQHCRAQPGVNMQLEKTGVSARYHVRTSHDQHVAAMAAIGLTPEVDTEGSWPGYQPGKGDPLRAGGGVAADTPHPLAAPAWRDATRGVFARSIEVHGESILERNGWQHLWAAVQVQAPVRAVQAEDPSPADAGQAPGCTLQ